MLSAIQNWYNFQNMSGHSKWSQIKRQKGAADVKRGQAFTKLGNAITIVTREGGGGDPAANFRLRLAIEQARAVNMPKENIQRAIDRGLGPTTASGLGQLESVTYEAYGSGKVALIIEATTDNRNRTLSEIKKILDQAGGTLVSPGTVSWCFSESGLIAVNKNAKSFDEVFEAAVEAGAEDVEEAGDQVEVYTKPQELTRVKEEIVSKGLTVESAELTKKPTTTVAISDQETAKKVMRLVENLEELDDVAKVYANFDIADTIWQEG